MTVARARKVIIIGSGPAGLTAALYAARANLNPLLIEGLEAGGQLMLTTMVENWPGFRDGIMGPDLMTEMRVQAERFGTQVMQGNVTSVDLQQRPFTVSLGDGQAVHGGSADRGHGRLGAVARDRVRPEALGPRRLHVRHLRRLLLQGQADRRHRRRRLGHGGSDLPDEVRVEGDRHPPPRLAARVEDHAGQGVRQSQDRVHLGLGSRRRPRRRSRAR